MKISRKHVSSIVAGFLFMALLNSCGNSKKLTYFREIGKDSTASIETPSSPGKINRNDILQINISSLDVQANSIFNGSNGADNSSAKTTPEVLNGNLVDESGNIKLPLIGSIQAAGLDKSELADTIANLLVSKKIALDPIVTVRIVSYKITVLGEVNHPGVIPIPNEKITLLEALGFAGDLTAYAKRDNILLIREKDGKRTFRRFSLNDSKVFNKDYYYLQNKDVIYVEPMDSKAALTSRSNQLIPIILSALSVLILTLTYLKK